MSWGASAKSFSQCFPHCVILTRLFSNMFKNTYIYILKKRTLRLSACPMGSLCYTHNQNSVSFTYTQCFTKRQAWPTEFFDRNCRILPFFCLHLVYFILLYLSRLARGYIFLSSPHSQRTQYNSFKLSLLCNTGLRRCLQSFGVYTNKEIADYATVTHWPQNLRGLTQQSIHLSHSSCLKLVSPQCVPWSHSGFGRLW